MNIPLHPLVVHFPIVLAILLPVGALLALWAIHRNGKPLVSWAIPFAITVVLLGSAYVATRTGEAEEEKVERVVPENALHEHEEAAERFLILAAIVTIVAAAGLLRGTVGSLSRAAATVGSFVIVFAGVQVGKAGGELVYEHNAGSAYSSAANTNGEAADDGEYNEDD